MGSSTSSAKKNISFHRINVTVVLVLCLILFIYGTVVFCTVLPWLENSVPGVTHTACLSFTTGMALYCFLGCVLLDPGRVPADWHLRRSEEGTAVVEVKKTSGKQRFCQKCQNGKPARSHHCRVCKRCVLRMDHHCPWMNNCIGQANYKGFMLFLIYINAAALHSLVLLLAAMWLRLHHTLGPGGGGGGLRQHLRDAHVQQEGGAGAGGDQGGGGGGGGVPSSNSGALPWEPSQTIVQTVTLVLLGPLSIGLLLLLAWNLYLMLSNKTTIEYHEGVTARIRAARQGLSPSAYQHPYDLGPPANLSAICGPSVSCWLWPRGLGAAGEGGLTFPTVWDRREVHLVSVAPPAQGSGSPPSGAGSGGGGGGGSSRGGLQIRSQSMGQLHSLS